MWIVFDLSVIELYCKETAVFPAYLIMNKNDYLFFKKKKYFLGFYFCSIKKLLRICHGPYAK
jgi:hypothetical protein